MEYNFIMVFCLSVADEGTSLAAIRMSYASGLMTKQPIQILLGGTVVPIRTRRHASNETKWRAESFLPYMSVFLLKD